MTNGISESPFCDSVERTRCVVDYLLSPSRRKLLRLAALATASSVLSGCRALLTKRPTVISRILPENPEPKYPSLTIDTHCHVFNGSDIQAKGFFERVVKPEKGLSADLVDVFSDVLQDLEWSGAPDGNEELVVLSELKKCSNDGIIVAVANLEQNKYGNANKAIRSTKAFTQYSRPALSAFRFGIGASMQHACNRDLDAPLAFQKPCAGTGSCI
jgi:hypothetical protein